MIFVSCYAEDVEIYNFGETTAYIQGLENLKTVYADVFEQSPQLHATIKNRIVFDNKVIDEEHVTGRKGAELIKVVVIYEVEGNLIAKVSFIRDHSK